jgi:hypothetical protein
MPPIFYRNHLESLLGFMTEKMPKTAWGKAFGVVSMCGFIAVN